MLNLQSTTWIRFGIWMAVGLFVYFLCSYRHSGLATGQRPPSGAVPEPEGPTQIEMS